MLRNIKTKWSTVLVKCMIALYKIACITQKTIKNGRRQVKKQRTKMEPLRISLWNGNSPVEYENELEFFLDNQE